MATVVEIRLTPHYAINFEAPEGIKLGEDHQDFLEYLAARDGAGQIIDPHIPEECYTLVAMQALDALLDKVLEYELQHPEFPRTYQQLQERLKAKGEGVSVKLRAGDQPIPITIFPIYTATP